MSYLHPSQKNAQIGPISQSNQYHVGVLQGNWFEERFSFGPQPSRDFKFDAQTEHHDQFPARTLREYKDARPDVFGVTEMPRELLFGQGPAGKTRANMLTVHELCYNDISRGDRVLSTEEVIAIEGNSPRRDRSTRKRIENGTCRAEELEEVRCIVNAEAAPRDSATSAGPLRVQFTNTAESNKEGTPAEATETQDVPAATGDAPNPTGSLGGTFSFPRNASLLTSQRARQQFLTTKNVTHDAAGEYIMNHPESFARGHCHARGAVIHELDEPMTQTQFRKPIQW